jgi:hypothetical protein
MAIPPLTKYELNDEAAVRLPYFSASDDNFILECRVDFPLCKYCSLVRRQLPCFVLLPLLAA